MGYLLQMAGFPGTGKSTLASYISKELGAIVLDRDIIKNSMLVSGIEGEVLNMASYNVLYEMASNILAQGKNVIIDTPCYYNETVDNGLEIACKNNVDYRFIECIIDDFAIVQERLESRDRLETQIESTTSEMYYRCYDKSKKPKNINCLSLDTRDVVSIDIEILREYLEQGSVTNASSMYIR